MRGLAGIPESHVGRGGGAGGGGGRERAHTSSSNLIPGFRLQKKLMDSNLPAFVSRGRKKGESEKEVTHCLPVWHIHSPPPNTQKRQSLFNSRLCRIGPQ